ncbi:MAG: hypothetical protein AB8H86_18395 [Polyangiales bacterium]
MRKLFHIVVLLLISAGAVMALRSATNAGAAPAPVEPAQVAVFESVVLRYGRPRASSAWVVRIRSTGEHVTVGGGPVGPEPGTLVAVCAQGDHYLWGPRCETPCTPTHACQPVSGGGS